MTGSRTTQPTSSYVVQFEAADRGVTAAVCSAVLDVLRPRATIVVLDAFSDFRDALPPDVARAEEQLRALGRAQHRKSSGMAIELDSTDASMWQLLQAYASWSIHVEVTAASGQPIATLHDCGDSIVAELSAGEHQLLAARLTGLATLAPLIKRPSFRQRRGIRQRLSKDRTTAVILATIVGAGLLGSRLRERRRQGRAADRG